MNISIPNCNALQNIPYDSFWEKIAKIHTPIIEPHATEDKLCNVTFLYKSTEDITHVVLATYGLCSYEPKMDQLYRLPNTDIFYRTYVFPNDLKTIYCFSPNDSLVNLADNDLYSGNVLPMVENWQPDSFNPEFYTIPGWLILGEQEKTFSLLKLPCASDSAWAETEINSASGQMSQHTVKGNNVSLSRDIKIYKTSKTVPDNYHYPLVTFFDGDAYLEFSNAATILDNLIDAEMIPPVIAVFISNPPPNTITRWNDLCCNETYTQFIADNLIPWVHANFPTSHKPENNVLIGASFGGLAAVFLGLRYPHVIGNIMAQSGAFFWRPPEDKEDDWLMKQFSMEPKHNLKFCLNVGCTETALTFNKGASILNSNRHLRDVLIAKGYSVLYNEYAGGHDYICWQDALPEALMKIFSK